LATAAASVGEPRVALIVAMFALEFGLTEIDPSSELTGSLSFNRLSASCPTASDVTTSMLVWVVRAGSSWPLEKRLLPNSASVKFGSRNRSCEEAEYSFGERSDSATDSATLASTTVITISLRRHSTDSNSNGDTVAAAGALSTGSRSATAIRVLRACCVLGQ